MLAHGLSSSALFWVTGLIYHRRLTRQVKFLGWLGGASSALSFGVTLALLQNFGVPPFLGFFPEVFGGLAVLGVAGGILFLLLGYLGLTCYFSLFYLVSTKDCLGSGDVSGVSELLSLLWRVGGLNLALVGATG